MKRRFSIYFFTFVFASFSWATLTQDTLNDFGILSYGDSVSGEIRNGAPEFWQFEGRAGDVVRIEIYCLPSDWSCNSRLDLLNTNGARLFEDDNSGEDWQALIVAPLSYDGMYTIVARGDSREDSGIYDLSLQKIEPTAHINIGETYNGSLENGTDINVVTFEANAGDFIRLNLDVDNPDVFHSRFSLAGPSSWYIWDEEYYSVDTPRDLTLVLYEDGTYSMIVSTHWGAEDEGGDYSISLGLRDVTPENIEYGADLEVVLEGDPPIYQFEGNAGDMIVINANTRSFISKLYLGGPGGVSMTDMASGVMSGSFMPNIVLPQDGTYTILPWSYYDEEGYFGYTFDLHLDRVSPADSDELLNYGDVVVGELVRETVSLHSFMGNIGDQVSLYLVSEDFDALVMLYGPSGFIAADDYSGGFGNALIPTITLREDGLYTVIVDTYSGLSGGEYTLYLQEGFMEQATILSYGDEIEATLQSEGVDIYQFEGQFGDAISIESEDLGSTAIRPHFYHTYGDYDEYGLLDDLVLYDDGIYTILMSASWSEDGGDYFLSLGGDVYDNGEDGDGDGFTDLRDRCPDVAGTIQGCPDSDDDGIVDILDRCPDESGPVDGCPDSDNDGVADNEDVCPDEPGSIAARGCPDADNDGIIDSEDECPDQAGTADFNGCPDSDGDGIVDAEDECPDDAGLVEFGGCLFTGTVSNNVNLRGGSGTTFAVVGTAYPGVEFMILGRNETGDWLNIRTTGDNMIEAWIFADLVTTEVEIDELPVIGE